MDSLVYLSFENRIEIFRSDGFTHKNISLDSLRDLRLFKNGLTFLGLQPEIIVPGSDLP